jgi:hypothetical protein
MKKRSVGWLGLVREKVGHVDGMGRLVVNERTREIQLKLTKITNMILKFF